MLGTRLVIVGQEQPMFKRFRRENIVELNNFTDVMMKLVPKSMGQLEVKVLQISQSLVLSKILVEYWYRYFESDEL